METIKITHIEYDNDPDFDELFMRINTNEPQPSYAVPVNDDTDEHYDVYLDVHPETHQVVSAFIFYARNMFDDLARAFANKDLNHPDVRFFLEKKLELYAERHAAEIVESDSTKTAAAKPAPALQTG
ncbi:MAG: hypothetical protein HY327_11385 [Chloroflexi bacterium]|nr:hypothetical protein [Chloroflexota bacterium]